MRKLLNVKVDLTRLLQCSDLQLQHGQAAQPHQQTARVQQLRLLNALAALLHPPREWQQQVNVLTDPVHLHRDSLMRHPYSVLHRDNLAQHSSVLLTVVHLPWQVDLEAPLLEPFVLVDKVILARLVQEHTLLPIVQEHVPVHQHSDHRIDVLLQ